MLSRNDYLWYLSEIATMERFLEEIPEENVIERFGYESRLASAREAIKDVSIPPSRRLKLTFRGQPVVGTYGIHSDFLGQALDKFTTVVAAIVASLRGKLSDKGRIAEKQNNPILVVGSAIGSFGFELELPDFSENTHPDDPDVSCESVKKIQAIFQTVAEGSDEELSELISEVHPRAIDNVRDFLNYQVQHKAWCGLDFDGRTICFQNEDQLTHSASRLAKDNIVEEDVSFVGMLIGVLPSDRRFELETAEGDIKKGRTRLTLEEGKKLLKECASNTVKITLKEVRAGQGNSRYILESLENVKLDYCEN